MIIQFYNADKPVRLSKRKSLKSYLASLFQKEGSDVESVTYIFCSDEYLLKINQDFLRHDDYTDIITFSLGNESAPTIGEIYISIDRVDENATLLKVIFHVELHRVIFHGALHLCGYKDKTTAEKKLMRKREEFYLKGYGLSL
ncbi:MAG: rRNA maturation RNase YbeY [Ferruginibacter sp.]